MSSSSSSYHQSRLPHIRTVSISSMNANLSNLMLYPDSDEEEGSSVCSNTSSVSATPTSVASRSYSEMFVETMAAQSFYDEVPAHKSSHLICLSEKEDASLQQCWQYVCLCIERDGVSFRQTKYESVWKRVFMEDTTRWIQETKQAMVNRQEGGEEAKRRGDGEGEGEDGKPKETVKELEEKERGVQQGSELSKNQWGRWTFRWKSKQRDKIDELRAKQAQRNKEKEEEKAQHKKKSAPSAFKSPSSTSCNDSKGLAQHTQRQTRSLSMSDTPATLELEDACRHQ